MYVANRDNFLLDSQFDTILLNDVDVRLTIIKYVEWFTEVNNHGLKGPTYILCHFGCNIEVKKLGVN